MKTYVTACAALLLCACKSTQADPQSRVETARQMIEGRLGHEHPQRSLMSAYAERLDYAIQHQDAPDAREAMRSAMIADNCLGFFPQGHAISKLRTDVENTIAGGEDGRRTYLRYLEASSSMALTREDVDSCDNM